MLGRLFTPLSHKIKPSNFTPSLPHLQTSLLSRFSIIPLQPIYSTTPAYSCHFQPRTLQTDGLALKKAYQKLLPALDKLPYPNQHHGELVKFLMAHGKLAACIKDFTDTEQQAEMIQVSLREIIAKACPRDHYLQIELADIHARMAKRIAKPIEWKDPEDYPYFCHERAKNMSINDNILAGLINSLQKRQEEFETAGEDHFKNLKSADLQLLTANINAQGVITPGDNIDTLSQYKDQVRQFSKLLQATKPSFKLTK